MDQFHLTFSLRVDKIFQHIAKTNISLHEQIERQLEKLICGPYLGKPLRHDLKHQRRLHVGSFVVIYEIMGNEIHVLDFDHHDRIYKKKR